MHLKKGAQTDLEAASRKALHQPGAASEKSFFLSQQGVAGFGLDVQHNTNQLGPALHPLLSELLRCCELIVANHQAQQQFTAGNPSAQNQLTQ